MSHPNPPGARRAHAMREAILYLLADNIRIGRPGSARAQVLMNQIEQPEEDSPDWTKLPLSPAGELLVRIHTVLKKPTAEYIYRVDAALALIEEAMPALKPKGGGEKIVESSEALAAAPGWSPDDEAHEMATLTERLADLEERVELLEREARKKSRRARNVRRAPGLTYQQSRKLLEIADAIDRIEAIANRAEIARLIEGLDALGDRATPYHHELRAKLTQALHPHVPHV